MAYRKEVVEKLTALAKEADIDCPPEPREFMLWLNGEVPYPDNRKPRCSGCGRYHNHPLCNCGL